MTPLENILSRVDRARSCGHGQYTACCPAHDDTNPSLSILESTDGKVLLHCRAGCPTPDVCAAMGVDYPRDLFPNRGKYKRPRFNHSDAREVLYQETRVIEIAAARLAHNEPLDDADLIRVQEAAQRISNVRILLEVPRG